MNMIFISSYIWVSAILQVQSSTVTLFISENNVTGNPITEFTKQEAQPSYHTAMELSTVHSDASQLSTFPTKSGSLFSTTASSKLYDLKTFRAGSFESLATECSSDSERICGCNSSCIVLNNCCYDSPFHSVDIQPNTTAECVHSIFPKLVLTSPAFLVTKCPADWRYGLVRGNCENPSDINIFSNIPCYSPDTDLSYLNMFCSECHRVNRCHTWELTFQSSSPFVPYNSINTVDKMIAVSGEQPLSRRGMQFVVSSRLSQPVAHCLQSPVDSCVAEFTTESLSRYCKTYFNPVVIAGTLYRNIHCFSCFTGISPEEAVVSHIRNRQVSAISILLDLDLQRGRTEQDKGVKKPIIMRIKGYCQTEFVYFHTSPVLNAESSELLKIQTDCVGIIRSIIHFNLRAYGSKVYVPRIGVDKGHLSFHIIVSIETDILVEEIAEIEREVRNLKFDLRFGKYNLTCCFDKNGTKWHYRPSMKARNSSLNTTVEDHFNISLSNGNTALKTAHLILVSPWVVSIIWAKWVGVCPENV